MLVRLKNFQSWKRVDFKVKGLTTITGQNNTGKSALIRALKGAFTNNPGVARSFVKHGEDSLSVDIDFNDGNTLLWERGLQNRYVINGVEVTGWGSGVPEPLSALGVHSIQSGNVHLWPQIADQFEGQLFLIDSPSTVVAGAITDVSLVSKLTDSLKHAEQDLRSLKSEAKVKQKDKLALEISRLKLSPIFDLRAKYLEIKSTSEHLSGVKRKLATLQKYSELLSEYNENLKTLDKRLKILKGILPLEIQSYKLSLTISKIDSLNLKCLTLKKLKKEQNKVNKATPQLPTTDFYKLNQKASTLSSLEKLRAKQEVLLTSNKTLQREIDSYQGNIYNLDSTEELKQQSDKLNNLLKLKQVLEDSLQMKDKINLAYKQTSERYTQTEAELKSIRSEMGICPVCLRGSCND